MEQNKLKSLILSMRKSKTNMSTKANTLAQAIETKGLPDMDTHELLNLLKDALTNRHNKEFYAEQLSQVIGEPNKGNGPTFKVVRMIAQDGNPTPSLIDFKLGDKMVYRHDEDSGNSQYDIYMFLTDDQLTKLQIEEHYNGFEVGESIKLFVMDDNFVEDLNSEFGIDVSEYSYYVTVYAIPINVVQSGGSVDIIYDGVTYTYDSSNCELDAPIG